MCYWITTKGATIRGMKRLHRTVARNSGMERWHGMVEVRGLYVLLDNYQRSYLTRHGTVAWNGGMEQWHGTVAVRGLYVLLDNEADRTILHSFLRVSPSRNSESKRVLSAIE